MYTANIELKFENKFLEADVEFYLNEEDDEFKIHSVEVYFWNWLSEKESKDMTFLREVIFETIKVKCLEVYEEEKSGYL